MKSKKTKSIAILIGAFGILGLSQPTQDSQQNPDMPALDPSLSVEPPPEPINQKPRLQENQIQSQTDWMPAPDNEEFQAQIANEPDIKIAKSKKPKLGDLGISDDWGDWASQNELDDQNIIDQTIHRKREIDPAKKLDLMELSRLLGTLHALRVSCTGAGDQTYRSKMNALLDLEAPSATFISEPLTISFNQGFEAFGGGEKPCPNDNGKTEAVYARKGFEYANKMAQYYLKLAQVENKN